MDLLKRYFPVLVATTVCWAIVATLSRIAVSQTGGTFTYPLDDTYIHLAVARTLVTSHVWGIGPQEFGSASSSPGWTLLLSAADMLFGLHVLTPLVMNLLLVPALLLVADYGLRFLSPTASGIQRLIVLLVITLLMPLHNLVLIAMEHVGQTLGVFALVLGGTLISHAPAKERPAKAAIALLIGGAFFAGAMRYESVFALVPVCVLLLLRKRFTLALLASLAAAIVPMAFGLYSHHLSGFWLPFSVLVKTLQHQSRLRNLHSLAHTRWQILLLLLFLAGLLKRPIWRPSQTLLLLTFVTMFEHMLLAPVGWLLRYESYVIGLAVLAVAAVVLELPPVSAWRVVILRLSFPERAFAALILLLAANLSYAAVKRSYVEGTVVTERACVDRFYEHIQMARFTKQFYDNSTIVLNDIGAVAYYSHAHVLDLIGLGSAEPLSVLHRTGHLFGPADAEGWATKQDAKIAILQYTWPDVQRVLPEQWTQVAIWHFPRNVVYGDRVFAMYAITPRDVPYLCASTRSYAAPPQEDIEYIANVCKRN